MKAQNAVFAVFTSAPQCDKIYTGMENENKFSSYRRKKLYAAFSGICPIWLKNFGENRSGAGRKKEKEMKKTGRRFVNAKQSAMSAGAMAWSSMSSALLLPICPVLTLLDNILAIPMMAVGIIFSIRYVIALVLAPVLYAVYRKGAVSLFKIPSSLVSLFRSEGISMVIIIAVIVVALAYMLKWLYRIFYLVVYPVNSWRWSASLALRMKEMQKRKNAWRMRYPDTPEGREKDIADFKARYNDKLFPL